MAGRAGAWQYRCGLADAVAAQVLAESVTEHATTVTQLARAALNSPAVRHAASRPHWRETYVGTTACDRVLEGFIDLLYRDDGLVIIDYKTDAVPATATEPASRVLPAADGRLRHRAPSRHQRASNTLHPAFPVTTRRHRTGRPRHRGSLSPGPRRNKVRVNPAAAALGRPSNMVRELLGPREARGHCGICNYGLKHRA